jgi:hypothetical protein
MLRASRLQCAVACHTRGCGKAYNNPLKNDCKPSTIKTIASSATKALLKPFAPAPGSGFACSERALEHFVVAVLIILVMYSIHEVNINNSNKDYWPMVRACLYVNNSSTAAAACSSCTCDVQHMHGHNQSSTCSL